MIRWVASYPKSGNTWLRLMMMAYEQGDRFDPNQRTPAYQQDTSRPFWERVSPVGVAPEDLPLAEQMMIRGAVLVHLMHWAQSSETPMILLKTHAALAEIDGQENIPPSLTDRAVYVVRDPRDVAPSVADHFGVSIDRAIGQMADEGFVLVRNGIPLFVGSWSLHVRSWQREVKFPVLSIRYEDLRQDPGAEFERVCRFFGFEPDPRYVRRAVDLTDLDRLRRIEDEVGYIPKSYKQSRFFRTGRVGGWREVLTAAQTRRIEADHGEAMASAGYVH